MFTTNKGIFQTASSMQSSLCRKSLRCASFVVHSAYRNGGVVSSPSTTLLSMMKLGQLGLGGQTNQLVGGTRSLRTKTPKKATSKTTTTTTKKKSSSRSKSNRQKKSSDSSGNHAPTIIVTRGKYRVKKNPNLQTPFDLGLLPRMEREILKKLSFQDDCGGRHYPSDDWALVLNFLATLEHETFTEKHRESAKFLAGIVQSPPTHDEVTAEEGLEWHHIWPLYAYGSYNGQNLVQLSKADHKKAHECFDLLFPSIKKLHGIKIWAIKKFAWN